METITVIPHRNLSLANKLRDTSALTAGFISLWVNVVKYMIPGYVLVSFLAIDSHYEPAIFNH